MKFQVEGRYFPNPLWAFTFAQIQADRMTRPVEVHLDADHEPRPLSRKSTTWHATAHPSHYVRSHLVKQPPAVLPALAVA